MKAVVKYDNEPGHVQLMDMPEPFCLDNQVLIEIEHCGICGTDLHVYHNRFRHFPPVILGHEFSGRVKEKGKAVKKLDLEDRYSVFGALSIMCGECEYCYKGEHFFCKNRRGMGHGVNGAFTKYAVVRPDQLYKIPDSVSMKAGALVEPLAAAVHAVCDVAKFKLGDTALVSGPGPIGLMVVKLLARQGVKTIVAGTSDDRMRLDLAIKYGAYKTVAVDKENLVEIIMAETEGYGANVVFEVAGVEASVRACMESLRPLGHYIQVGHFGKDLTLPWDLVAFRQFRIDGSVGYVRETWQNTMKILDQGFTVEDMITHEMDIDQWKNGFDLMEAKKAVKILLNPIQ
jgi:L-iditol 2-dehydrogenase